MSSAIKVGSTYSYREENGNNIILEVTGLTSPKIWHVAVFESDYIIAHYDVHEETILDNIKLGIYRKVK